LTLDTVNSLGLLYLNQGKLAEAEQMFQQGLQGKEKALGAEHTSTLQTVNNLGLLYKSQGKLDEAEQMYQLVLQNYEITSNPEHTSARNAHGGLFEIYCRHCASLRQEQRASDQAVPDNYSRGTIAAVADLCEKFGTVRPSFFSLLGRMLIWVGQDYDAILAFQYQFRLV
jgi:tetratricopeptide (TPR) repeat protein